METVTISGYTIPIYTHKNIILGSGVAAYNAADYLYRFGQTDVAVVTDGRNCGTSRNAGSDKQTYFKLSTSYFEQDSVLDMAKSLFDGGGMHGDIALVEAGLSLKGFYHLLEIGVPFPHDFFGQYIGYQTDHTTCTRATSVGPLTSKIMCEQLEKSVLKNNIPIYDNMVIVGLLTHKDSAVGVLALHRENSETLHWVLFNATNILLATGGPAAIYENSVYPKNQWGATGIALAVGAKANNLTEWQYGIASKKFRWNLSGTYQQVIPRYVSSEVDGSNEKEFLEDYFVNKKELVESIFLKGYQWPVDARKIADKGSSIIDILIYIETQIKNRKVYLDFQKNPKCLENNGKFDSSLLGEKSYQYLNESEALLDTPIARLEKMNPLAIELYKKHHIDLRNEYLEIDVCAQHHNGGLCGNEWWESNIKHLFPIGEVNGSLGIYRPGGSALNSTQVGSIRAAEYISHCYTDNPLSISTFTKRIKEQVEEQVHWGDEFSVKNSITSDIGEEIHYFRQQMSKHAAFIRSYEEIAKYRKEVERYLEQMPHRLQISHKSEVITAFRLREMLLAQIAMLDAMLFYIRTGAKSRGSYLIAEKEGNQCVEREEFLLRYSLDESFYQKVLESTVTCTSPIKIQHRWQPVRPIPTYDMWFENGWEHTGTEVS